MHVLAAVLLTQTKNAKPVTPKLTGPQVIDKMKAAVRAAVPITGTETIATGRGEVNMNFKFMYPNMVYEAMDYGTNGTTEIHWSGGPIYSFFGAKGYRADDPPATGKPIHLGLIGFEHGFSDNNLYRNIGSCREEKFQGKKAYAIEVILAMGKNPGETLHVDAKTFLPLGVDESVGEVKVKVTYSDVKTHVPLKPADFMWVPAPSIPRIN